MKETDIEVKPVFIITNDDERKILMPVIKELMTVHKNIMLYHDGPVCEEIKDRNVLVTSNRDRDTQLAHDFGVGIVCIGSCAVDQAISAIIREAEKGAR